MKNIVILGSNFAGLTAALQLNKKLRKRSKEYQVTVVSPSHDFLYVPSLIWVPFGRRKVSDIRFDLRPILQRKGISFIQQPAQKVDPDTNTVYLPDGKTLNYDYL